jgi:hypothetical protein
VSFGSCGLDEILRTFIRYVRAIGQIDVLQEYTYRVHRIGLIGDTIGIVVVDTSFISEVFSCVVNTATRLPVLQSARTTSTTSTSTSTSITRSVVVGSLCVDPHEGGDDSNHTVSEAFAVTEHQAPQLVLRRWPPNYAEQWRQSIIINVGTSTEIE